MVHQIANVYSKSLCRCGVINEKQVPVYTYGLELILASALNTSFILVISAICFQFASGLFFLLAFIPLRSTAGGYHAKSHLSCNLICLAAFSGLQVLGMMIPVAFLSGFYIVVALFVLLIVYLLSPCEAENKPLTESRKKRNRRRSIAISVCNLLLAFVIFLIAGASPLATSYYMGVLASAISLGVAKKWNQEERKL